MGLVDLVYKDGGSSNGTIVYLIAADTAACQDEIVVRPGHVTAEGGAHGQIVIGVGVHHAVTPVEDVGQPKLGNGGEHVVVVEQVVDVDRHAIPQDIAAPISTAVYSDGRNGDAVARVISRDDVNKPLVRMWLFGIVTMIEMGLVRMIEEAFPEQSWQPVVSAGRLEKAKKIQAERQRRNQYCDLIDCLQLSDKGQILLQSEPAMKDLGFETKRIAKRAVKELESLRNHLAHAQDIVSHDWAQIARMSKRLQEGVLAS